MAKEPTKNADGIPSKGLARRRFLQGAGFTAAGASVLDGVDLLAKEVAASRRPETLGPDRVPVSLKINGKIHKLMLEPRTTLADALRNDLGLTGTKVVCDRGSCSACTVMLDKTPVCSCMTLAVDVGPRAVTTIEGLSRGDELHPVQAAFVAHDALQCGFCTPGMVMSCAALLEKNPNPSLHDVKLAVSGNICRCGTYPKVFDAALAAAKGSRLA